MAALCWEESRQGKQRFPASALMLFFSTLCVSTSLFQLGDYSSTCPALFPFYGLFKRHAENAMVGVRQEVIPAPGDRWNDPLGLCQARS